jgi:uncharacterized protein (DUF433 family)
MSAAAKAQIPADYIEATPDVCGGKPRIRGTRIKVSEVAWRHDDGQSPDEIIEAFPHLTLAQVHAALAYYYDHHQEIEAQLREEDETVSALARKHDPTW